MANFIPDNTRNIALGTGTRIVWTSTTDTFKAMFVDHADDTPTTADDFIDDIASAARVPALGSCPTLGSKTVGVVGVGIADCADITFTALTGDQSESLIFFKDTGTESTSALLVRYDTATGLPLTPSGGDVTVVIAAGGYVTT
jgi:hypothetical protein